MLKWIRNLFKKKVSKSDFVDPINVNPEDFDIVKVAKNFYLEKSNWDYLQKSYDEEFIYCLSLLGNMIEVIEKRNLVIPEEDQNLIIMGGDDYSKPNNIIIP